MHALSLLSLALTLTAQPGGSAVLPMRPWVGVSFVAASASPPAADARRRRVTFNASVATQSTPRPMAFQYSHGYEVRLKIHKAASFAMLPLFGAEAVVGSKLFNNPTSRGLRSDHNVLNVAILGLFGLDTITGVWNLKEGWRDPHGRARRLLHALLMLAADAGFVATASLTPHIRNGVDVGRTSKTTHRDLAIGSISTATVGYLVMVFR